MSWKKEGQGDPLTCVWLYGAHMPSRIVPVTVAWMEHSM